MHAPPSQSPEDPAPDGEVEPRPRGRPILGATGVSGLYLAFVGAAWALTRILGERFWWSMLLLYAPQALYAVPALLTVPYAVWKRDLRELALSCIALGIVAGPMMGFSAPWPTQRLDAGAPRVRVLAYNIESGEAGLAPLRRHVERFQPDVVVLSEARAGVSRELDSTLRRLLPGWEHAAAGDVYVASRWPLGAREATTPDSSVNGRAMVRARVDAPFGRFSVVGVHFRTARGGETLSSQRHRLPAYLRSAAAVRMRQAQGLLDWTARLDEPVIVAGDFNTPPAGRVYGRLRRRFGDAFAERGWGWGFTFPAQLPALRIDYVFHSRHWDTARSLVGEGLGSDHRPVFAELSLARAK